MENFVKKYNISLTNQQIEVVSDTSDHMFICGESGTGKTHTFLARSAYLTNVKKVSTMQLLNICTSEGTCAHISKQYRLQYQEENITPTFMTLYAFSYRVLKRFHEKAPQALIKAYRDLDEVIAKVTLDTCSVVLRKPQLNTIRKQISFVKHNMSTQDEINEMNIEGLAFAPIYKAYEDFKQKKKMMDYDDMLVQAYRILSKEEEILKEFQQFYCYIQVDDAQDLSVLAHQLIWLLHTKHNQVVFFANTHVFHAQSGAKLMSIEDFKTHYESDKVYNWNENFGASRSCVKEANEFLYQEETITTSNEPIDDIGCKGFADTTRLYAYAKKQALLPEQKATFVYKDIAYALPLIDDLDKQEIAYEMHGGFDSFFHDVIIQELLDYVTLIIDSKDVDSFACMYSSMNFDITEKIAREVIAMLREDDNMDIFEAMVRSSMKIVRRKELSAQMELIRMLPEKETYEILKGILGKLGYERRLKTLRVPRRDSHLLVLYTMALRYPEPHEFIERMRNLSVLRLSHKGAIQVLPVEQVQCSNANTIYAIDCVEGNFPSHSENTLVKSDERNAITRCMAHASHLELFGFKSVADIRCEISSFIFEVAKKKKGEEDNKTVVHTGKIRKISEIHLKVGKRINHSTLGDGIIKNVKDGMMEVHFDSEEVKNLNIKYCLTNEMINLI